MVVGSLGLLIKGAGLSNSEVGWNPYPQPSATLLGFILSSIAIILIYFGLSRLSEGLKPKRPGKVAGIFMIVVWGLSGVTLLTFYSIVKSLTETGAVFPPSPIAHGLQRLHFPCHR